MNSGSAFGFNAYVHDRLAPRGEFNHLSGFVADSGPDLVLLADRATPTHVAFEDAGAGCARLLAPLPHVRCRGRLDRDDAPPRRRRPTSWTSRTGWPSRTRPTRSRASSRSRSPLDRADGALRGVRLGRRARTSRSCREARTTCTRCGTGCCCTRARGRPRWSPRMLRSSRSATSRCRSRRSPER